MSAIFYPDPVKGYPIRLVNVQTLGARCGVFRTHEEAEQKLRDDGYAEEDFWRSGNQVCFRGGINC